MATLRALQSGRGAATKEVRLLFYRKDYNATILIVKRYGPGALTIFFDGNQ